MFTHVEIWHIGFNMLALWFLGPQLELALGRARFLALYLLSGLAGSALVCGWPPSPAATLGASGAIFGLMGALLVVASRSAATCSTILMLARHQRRPHRSSFPDISWQGHLGGFLGGVLITASSSTPRGQRRTAWQVAGLSCRSAWSCDRRPHRSR